MAKHQHVILNSLMVFTLVASNLNTSAYISVQNKIEFKNEKQGLTKNYFLIFVEIIWNKWMNFAFHCLFSFFIQKTSSALLFIVQASEKSENQENLKSFLIQSWRKQQMSSLSISIWTVKLKAETKQPDLWFINYESKSFQLVLYGPSM